jgi:hypothetical protein
MLDAELVDRWAISEAQAETASDFYIDNVAHSIDFGQHGRHTLEATLSEASGLSAFQIGVSRLVGRRRNEVPNPSFELILASGGWSIVDGGVPSFAPVRDDTPLHSLFGECNAQFDNSASGQDDYMEIDFAGLRANTAYTFSAYVDARGFLAPALSNRGLYAWDITTLLSSQTATLAAANGGYTRLSATVITTADFGAHTIRARLYAPQGMVRWDGVQLEEGSSATAYFDGSQEGYVWEGAPHLSPSIEATPGDVFVY